jgi:hypothetical protein
MENWKAQEKDCIMAARNVVHDWHIPPVDTFTHELNN